nr:acetyl-CoA carboxylase, carboxyltransferase subunit beta [Gehongia tenuis]
MFKKKQVVVRNIGGPKPAGPAGPAGADGARINSGKLPPKAPAKVPAPPAAKPVRGAEEETAGAMWEKCPNCGKVIYMEDLMENHKVCPGCGYHFRITGRQRINYTVDEGTFEEFNGRVMGGNPLDFPGYEEKLKSARDFTGLSDAVITGTGKIGGNPAVVCAMDGFFMMGSMGAAVGEKITRAVEKAIELKLPIVIFTVSGGARMQEGLVSLMQMAKVSGALARLNEAGLLYITVLTDPTTGGVTASFAMLGDIILAEPDALIGFAGKRVIESTVKQTLPEGFQRAEFLLEKGFVDAIVPRHELPGALAGLLSLHQREVTA